MAESKIIKDVVEMVMNIPSTDTTPLEKFENTEQPKVSLTPEYTIIGSASGEDLIELVNTYMVEDWVTCWGVSVVRTSTWIRFYQAMERWRPNCGLKPEMPSENSEADTMGPKPLYIPGLELYAQNQ